MEPSSLPGAYLAGTVNERLRSRIAAGEAATPVLESNTEDGTCTTSVCKTPVIPCGSVSPDPNPRRSIDLPCSPSLDPGNC